MQFPIERYGQFEGWIPTTDIDGIDADRVQKRYLADSINVDYDNGLWRNARKPNAVALNSIVQAKLDNSWELLSVKKFGHETRGKCTFYTLYKEDAGHNLLFYIEDETDIYLLNIDEQSDDVVFEEKPSRITYSYADNQLKVNLNVKVAYNTLIKDVIANLTLGWIDRQSYNPTYTREEQWYLFPRWLGWTYDSPIVSEGLSSGTIWKEDFEDAGSVSDNKISVISGTVIEGFDHPNSVYYAENDDASFTRTAGLMIRNIVAAKKLSIALRTENCAHADFKLYVDYWRTDGEKVRVYENIYREVNLGSETDFEVIEIDLNKIWEGKPTQNETYPITTDSGIYITMNLPGKVASKPRVEVDYLKIEPIKAISVTANYDGQRSAFGDSFYLPVQLDDQNRRVTLEILPEAIDWRVATYEVYAQSANENIFYRILQADADNNDWIVSGSDLILENKNFLVETNTLNFYYGLGSTVKVFSEDDDGDLIGDYIYSEIFYRNRSYYVKDDSRIYFSHISGTGRPQSDSFPFDDDLLFGYIIVSEMEKCRSLAITPANEVLVRAESTSYLYVFELSSGTPFRRILELNGGQGILSEASAIESLDGRPLASYLMWADEWGLFAYAGGRNKPENMLEPAHVNWWNKISRSVKEGAVAVYYKPKNEYWLQLNDEILIFELSYKNFRKYKFAHKIKEYVGIEDEELYYLGNDNKLYVYSPENISIFSGYIQTHYATNYNVSENGNISSVSEAQDKILQEVYLLIQKAITGALQITFEVDDYKIPAQYFSTKYSRDVMLTPQLIRYGKIRYTVELLGKAVVKELGYTFYVPDHPLSSQPMNQLAGLGQNVGSSFGVYK